ncbi:hypothetical protein [Bacillus marinisedimentorum]|nr:hypothetical protein [Bacillus marinisedimentorum]
MRRYPYWKKGTHRKQVDLSGKVNLTEDGKIKRMIYYNANELLREMQTSD